MNWVREPVVLLDWRHWNFGGGVALGSWIIGVYVHLGPVSFAIAWQKG